MTPSLVRALEPSAVRVREGLIDTAPEALRPSPNFFSSRVWMARRARGSGEAPHAQPHCTVSADEHARTQMRRVCGVSARLQTHSECVFRPRSGGASQRSTCVSRSRVSKHTFGVRVSIDVWGCESTFNACFAFARFETHVWSACFGRRVGVRVNDERCVSRSRVSKTTFGVRVSCSRVSKTTFGVRVSHSRGAAETVGLSVSTSRDAAETVGLLFCARGWVASRRLLSLRRGRGGARGAGLSLRGCVYAREEKEVHLRAALRPVWGPSRATSCCYPPRVRGSRAVQRDGASLAGVQRRRRTWFDAKSCAAPSDP